MSKEKNKIEEIQTDIKEIKQFDNFKEAEWVFQFDNEEPIVFAWSDDSQEPGEVTITLKPNSNSSIAFASASGEKLFRMYSRPITEQTKLMRKLQDSSKK